MHSVWLYRIYRFTDTVWPAVIKFHCYEEWLVTHWAYGQKILIEQSTEPCGTLQCRDIQTAGKELQWRTKNNYSVPANFYVFSSEIYILQSEFKNAPKEQPYFFFPSAIIKTSDESFDTWTLNTRVRMSFKNVSMWYSALAFCHGKWKFF